MNFELEGEASRGVDPAEVDWSTTGAVFACSPRAGGNTDRAAALYAQGVAEGGGTAQVLALRTFQIMPCMACYRCEQEPGGHCHLVNRDQSGPLFDALLRAPVLFFSAPIFFYHVPAHFKSFIDRAQSFYLRRHAGDPLLCSLPPRTAHAVFVAGRPEGGRLFEGAALTLKYFLRPFNVELAEPLVFRGVDEPGDFESVALARDTVLQAGRLAGAAMCNA